jgi:hypothetical protein
LPFDAQLERRSNVDKLLVLFTMMFLHIVDDYYLQGWLASAKQKSWWEKNAPDKLYKHDYIIALFMHSFSWSFMVMMPTTVYLLLHGRTWFPLLYVLNLVIHMIVDNMKANQHKINLIEDQLIHISQIIITWLIIISTV